MSLKSSQITADLRLTPLVAALGDDIVAPVEAKYVLCV